MKILEENPASVPPVVRWYRFYAACMVLAGLACILGGLYLFTNTETILKSTVDVTQADIELRAAVIMAIGVFMMIAFTVARFLPNTPNAWNYHLVMIALGAGNCCIILAMIVMLIAWFKPETQEYFGRHVAPEA